MKTILAQQITKNIDFVRSQKIMFDQDLAKLYNVDTRVLLQAVKRNIKRFPSDFMFQLTPGELSDWRSHFVISNPGAKMGLRRHSPGNQRTHARAARKSAPDWIRVGFSAIVRSSEKER